MWTLNESLELIRKLQPKLKEINFHVTLGGGVLNTGQSKNDLDLYFLPLEDDSRHPDDLRESTVHEVMAIMYKITGNFGTGMEEYEQLRTSYRNKLNYKTQDGKEIDVFIV